MLQPQNKAASNTNGVEYEPIDRLMQTSPQQQPLPAARQFFTYEISLRLGLSVRFLGDRSKPSLCCSHLLRRDQSLER